MRFYSGSAHAVKAVALMASMALVEAVSDHNNFMSYVEDVYVVSSGIITGPCYVNWSPDVDTLTFTPFYFDMEKDFLAGKYCLVQIDIGQIPDDLTIRLASITLREDKMYLNNGSYMDAGVQVLQWSETGVEALNTYGGLNFPASHSGEYSGDFSQTLTEDPEVWMSCDRSNKATFPYSYQLELHWYPSFDMPSGWGIGDYVPPLYAGDSNPDGPMWMDLGFEWKAC